MLAIVAAAALFPSDASFIARRPIPVDRDTVSTAISRAEGAGCVLRHDRAGSDRTLHAGTRLVLGAPTHPKTGEKGMYAAVFPTNFRDVSLYCSTFPDERLTMGSVINAVSGAFEFARSAPRKLTQIAAAASRLESPRAAQLQAVVFEIP